MLKGAGLLRLGWRQFRRDFASGEARVLFAALVLAVFAIATVSFITDRAQNALGQEANRLLGGDVVLRADTPIEAATRKFGADLEQAELWSTMSMLRAPSGMRLGELRALDENFPLRGMYRLRDADGSERDVRGAPPSGERTPHKREGPVARPLPRPARASPCRKSGNHFCGISHHRHH